MFKQYKLIYHTEKGRGYIWTTAENKAEAEKSFRQNMAPECFNKFSIRESREINPIPFL